MKDEGIHILSLGAGVQSTALYLMAANDIIGPRPQLAIFADTQFEPPAVYEHLKRLQDHGQIPIEIVSAGDLRKDTIAGTSTGRKFASLPFFVTNEEGKVGMLRRQCTADYKIRPIRKAIREVLENTPHRKATLWIGISAEESQRAKPSNVKYLIHRWPLLELGLKRHHLTAFLESQGFNDVIKSSCIGCPFHDDATWLDMKQNRPSDFQDAIDFDEKIRNVLKLDGEAFIHRSGKPLSQVVFNHEGQLDMFGLECEGMCGV